ncbi:MAG: hypothetical protein GX548_00635 [Lentisphaerae bacterium]|nr:hypothetical protein [Lentisphaerota bacterium]
MKGADVDTSGFQSIVLMLIGVLMIMLISNVLTIISNPENIKIGAVVTGAIYDDESDEEETFIPPKFQNLRQDPVYLDVEADRLTIYPEQEVILARDLMFEGNKFEELLDQVEQMKDVRYIVLLMRPGSAVFQRRLRQVIRDRGIDVGFEPWEAGREIIVEGSGAEEEEEPAAVPEEPAAEESA